MFYLRCTILISIVQQNMPRLSIRLHGAFRMTATYIIRGLTHTVRSDNKCDGMTGARSRRANRLSHELAPMLILYEDAAKTSVLGTVLSCGQGAIAR